VFNDQGVAGLDNTYTSRTSSNPISGGTYEDLIWAKRTETSGSETPDTIVRNPNFGNVTGRYSPFSVTFGARLSF
jgi:hypothetical protein